MRVLVADKSAPLLAAITATFGRHCDLVTATHRDVCDDWIERQTFDVVVACDDLADYTGLELLSEVGSASPETLLIFVASAERLKRLERRLTLFGLFETLTYPLTPRKLLEALKRARSSRPPRAAPKVPHVVLESQWDTGERLGLIEQQLEAEARQPASESDPVDEFVFAAPILAVPILAPPLEEAPAPIEEVPAPVEEAPAPTDSAPAGGAAPTSAPCADSAANDSVFDATSHPARSPQEPLQSSPVEKPSQEKQASAPGRAPGPTASRGAQQPRVRQQADPTDAQRAAFERALARRNAERDTAVRAPVTGGQRRRNRTGFASALLRADQANSGQSDPGAAKAGVPSGGEVGSLFADSPRSPLPPESLSQLARMAVNKRPLAESMAASKRMMASQLSQAGKRLGVDGLRPKRAAFALGSGLAAVLVIAVLTFELLRTPHASAQMAHAPSVNSHVFGASPEVASVEGPAPAPFSPTPVESAPAETNTIQPPAPQFDPDTAPADPPPPPAVEQPPPTEPSPWP